MLMFIFAAPAAAQDTLRPRRAIEIALANNYSVRIVRNQQKIADNNAHIGNAGFLPVLNAAGGANYSVNDVEMDLVMGQKINNQGSVSKGYNGSAELQWTIFDGFGMFISYDRLELLRDKSDIELQLAMEEMTRNLVATFYDAVRAKKNMQIARKTLELSRQRYQKARDRAEYGTAPKIELLNAEVDLNTDSSRYMQSRLSYKNILRSLNFVMGRNTNEKFVPVGEDIDYNIPPLKDVRESASDNNNSINKAIAERDISRRDHNMVLASLYPRISLTGGYSYSRTESDGGFFLYNVQKGFNASVNASVNIFNGFRTSIRAENAQIAVQMNEVAIERMRAQIDLNVINTYENYKMLAKMLSMEKSAVETARMNFSRTRELYDLGQVTSVDLRQAQINLMRAENRLSDVEYQKRVAATELLLLTGHLLDEFRK
jgi:outer membrane protein TolC